MDRVQDDHILTARQEDSLQTLSRILSYVHSQDHPAVGDLVKGSLYGNFQIGKLRNLKVQFNEWTESIALDPTTTGQTHFVLINHETFAPTLQVPNAVTIIALLEATDESQVSFYSVEMLEDRAHFSLQETCSTIITNHLPDNFSVYYGENVKTLLILSPSGEETFGMHRRKATAWTAPDPTMPASPSNTGGAAPDQENTIIIQALSMQLKLMEVLVNQSTATAAEHRALFQLQTAAQTTSSSAILTAATRAHISDSKAQDVDYAEATRGMFESGTIFDTVYLISPDSQTPNMLAAIEYTIGCGKDTNQRLDHAAIVSREKSKQTLLARFTEGVSVQDYRAPATKQIATTDDFNIAMTNVTRVLVGVFGTHLRPFLHTLAVSAAAVHQGFDIPWELLIPLVDQRLSDLRAIRATMVDTDYDAFLHKTLQLHEDDKDVKRVADQHLRRSHQKLQQEMAKISARSGGSDRSRSFSDFPAGSSTLPTLQGTVPCWNWIRGNCDGAICTRPTPPPHHFDDRDSTTAPAYRAAILHRLQK
jgi:hypothetical protein